MELNNPSSAFGALNGGAIGEALGNRNITDSFSGDEPPLELGPATKASLFVANGLLLGDTRMADKGQGSPHVYDAYALAAWDYSKRRFAGKPTGLILGRFWLLGHPELYTPYKPTYPVTTLLRIAPHALYESRFHCLTTERILVHIAEDNELSAAAALLVSILVNIVSNPGLSLHSIIGDYLRNTHYKEIIIDSPYNKIIAHSPRLQYLLLRVLDGKRPCTAARSEDEILATALYCCLTRNSFEDIMNEALHCGGHRPAITAVTGTVAGALLGDSAIPESMTRNFAQLSFVREIAADIVSGALLSFGPTQTAAEKRWSEKY